VIWDKFQPQIQEALDQLNAALNGHKTPYKVTTGGREGKLIQFDRSGTVKLPSGEEAPANALLEWEVPREAPTDWPASTHKPLEQFWKAKIARQKEIDKSIAAKADQEFLYDKPYEDKTIVRVAGPFTVESLSPHRVLAVDENDELIDPATKPKRTSEETNFSDAILETLRVSGVQQAHKEGKINFTSLVGWPGDYICADGRYLEAETETEKRAGIFIGPEFGTVSRQDLVQAARECGDKGFDVLISCAFSYDAHSSELTKFGRLTILKARMNADLHMATDLKDTKAANLFCIFGEPDIVVASEEWLVDSMGTMVAPYEIFKIVSGLESLAEIDRLSRTDLWHYAELSCRREIWDYIANAAGINIHSSQHCGGTSTPDNWRISSVSWDCARLLGGTGNLPNLIRKIKLSHQDGLRELISQLCGNQQNVKRTHKSPGKGETNPQKSNSSLTPSHSPLATIHKSQITIHGVDVFHPQSGEVRSSNADEIACWFIDTAYNDESFFVRHAYFLGANDPYKSLKTTLKAEIDEEAWSTLHSDTSRPFNKPKSGRIAVKVINHLGDEVMKVFSV
jgi:adenine-specific DNA-methyltransferase